MAKQKRSDWGQIWKFRGKWTARWWEFGKLRQKSFVGPKDVAVRFLALKRAELERIGPDGMRPIDVVKFEVLADRYEEIFAGEKAKATLVREGTTLKNVIAPFFGKMTVDKIARADVEAFLTSRAAKDGISAGTRNRNLTILSRLFKKAVALNHCRTNPCAGIGRVRETLKDVVYLDLDGQQKLVDACAPPLRELVGLLFDCGLRLGEALRLEWGDVDWQRQTVTVRVSKTKRPRTVPFTKRGAAALKGALARRGDGGPDVPDRVFWDLSEPKKTGELNLRTLMTAAWNRARKAAGHPTFRLHDCRHCWAATMLRAGVPPNDLASLGGWGSLAMVSRYGRHVPGNAGDLARERLSALLERPAATTEPVATTPEAHAG